MAGRGSRSGSGSPVRSRYRTEPVMGPSRERTSQMKVHTGPPRHLARVDVLLAEGVRRQVRVHVPGPPPADSASACRAASPSQVVPVAGKAAARRRRCPPRYPSRNPSPPGRGSRSGTGWCSADPERTETRVASGAPPGVAPAGANAARSPARPWCRPARHVSTRTSERHRIPGQGQWPVLAPHNG